jgi:DNA mismatch repair protein MSH5
MPFEDGAGIFCGVIKHLLARGDACPKVLATTHFHEIFDREVLDVGALPITMSHMEVLITSDDGEILKDEHGQAIVNRGERITYLYRYAPES